MSRRNATDPDTAEDRLVLSSKQELAVDLLATGASVTAAAVACEVTRQTVSGWLTGHPGFGASLNRRRQELWDESADRAGSLVPKALDVLAEELAGEKRLTAAVHIMRAAGVHGLPAPTGATDPEEIEANQNSKRFDLALRMV